MVLATIGDIRVGKEENREEDRPETLNIQPQLLVSQTNRQACLVHIYPTGPGMGTRYTLADKVVVLGRSEGCEIRIQDRSVSRRHAQVQPEADGYYVVDLQSTNGTLVNHVAQPRHKLQDGDYLRVGNAIYRYLDGGNIEAEYHEEIYRLTIMDGLTEIHNKRYFTEFLTRELARSGRHGRPLALIMFDLDHFKRINDRLGHVGGDFTLREVVSLVRRDIRTEDLFARYGGEEFALVLVECSQEGAVLVAERLRQRIEAHPFTHEGKTFPVTISLGVACTRGDVPLTPIELVQRADENLYEAKRRGRNRFVC